VPFVAVARAADLTDLLALGVLPVAVRPAGPLRRSAARRWAAPAMALGCVFAFGATSRMYPTYNLSGEYRLPMGAEEVLTRIHTLRLDYADPGVPPGTGGPVSLLLPPEDSTEAARGSPWEQPTVVVEVEDAPGGSVLRLTGVQMPGRYAPRDSVRARFERLVVERVRRDEPNPVPARPLVSGADALFRPRLVAPLTLTEPRAVVTIRLARPAAVALIEVGVDDEWRVIYPVSPADERPLAAGESRLTTLCATTKVGGSYEAADRVPPCGVSRPITPGVAGRVGRGAAGSDPGEGGRFRRYTPIRAGRLILLASDAPLSRARLEAALADPAFPRDRLYAIDLQNALGRLVRAAGGSRAAASETLLRR
jgi:hypothetical protein